MSEHDTYWILEADIYGGGNWIPARRPFLTEAEARTEMQELPLTKKLKRVARFVRDSTVEKEDA